MIDSWGACLSLNGLSLRYHLQNITRLSTDSCYNLAKVVFFLSSMVTDRYTERSSRVANPSVQFTVSADDEAEACHALWVTWQEGVSCGSCILYKPVKLPFSPAWWEQLMVHFLKSSLTWNLKKPTAGVALIKWNKMLFSHVLQIFFCFHPKWKQKCEKQFSSSIFFFINCWNAYKVTLQNTFCH